MKKPKPATEIQVRVQVLPGPATEYQKRLWRALWRKLAAQAKDETVK